VNILNAIICLFGIVSVNAISLERVSVRDYVCAILKFLWCIEVMENCALWLIEGLAWIISYVLYSFSLNKYFSSHDTHSS